MNTKQLNRLKELTANNAHGEALLFIAETHAPQWVATFKLINELHNIDGHLQGDLYNYRTERRRSMFAYLRTALTVQQIEDINKNLA